MAAGSPFIQLEDSVSDPSATDSEKVNKQLNNQRNQYLLTLQRAYSRYHDSLVRFVDNNSRAHFYTTFNDRSSVGGGGSAISSGGGSGIGGSSSGAESLSAAGGSAR
jgi:uncharacterized membrane protein